MPHFDQAFGGDTAANYQKYFVPLIGRPIAADLIKAAGIKKGDRVLDVATGTGAAAFLAKEKAGPQGRVAGVDLNPGMLQTARALAQQQNSGSEQDEGSIEWYHSSADDLPFDDESFDVVICNLSLQFFPDKPAALREMRRVLVPGGRLAFILPAPEPVFDAAADVFSCRLGPEPAGFVRAVFSLYDQQEIETLLKEAGFMDITIRVDKKPLRLPPPKEFLAQYISGMPFSAAASKLNDEEYTALEREMVERWDPFVEDGNLIFVHYSIVALALREK